MSKYIIEVDDNAVANGCYQIVGTNNVLVSPNGIDTLEKYEEPAEEEQPFPRIGDLYYNVLADATIDHNEYDNDSFDKKLMSIGNIFRTKEEAEFEVERLKVLSEMRKFAEPFGTKWNYEEHYYIYYSLNDRRLVVSCLNSMRCNELYFESRERANECIEAIGADIIKKYYIGVE